MITLASPRKLVKCAKKFFPALSPSVCVQGTLSAFMSFWLLVCVTGWLFVRPVYLKERKPFLKTTAYLRVSKRLSDNSMVSWICWKDRSKCFFFFQLFFFTCLEEIFVRRSGAAQFLNSNCYGKRNITLDVEFTGIFIGGDYSKFELIEVESAKLYNNWVI